MRVHTHLVQSADPNLRLRNSFLDYLKVEKGLAVLSVSAYRSDLDQYAEFLLKLMVECGKNALARNSHKFCFGSRPIFVKVSNCFGRNGRWVFRSSSRKIALRCAG